MSHIIRVRPNTSIVTVTEGCFVRVLEWNVRSKCYMIMKQNNLCFVTTHVTFVASSNSERIRTLEQENIYSDIQKMILSII